MDSISQVALGASIGEVLLGKKLGGRGALAGALIATIPDLDVVLYLCYDKLEMLSIHRGFSHSILFSILGGIVIAWILSKLSWFKEIPFCLIIFFTWSCLFTHMLLDTFTAYGTQLLLPFSNRRIGLDSINVVDPAYTVLLIFGLLFSLSIYNKKATRSIPTIIGLVVSSAYLIFTLITKQNVVANITHQLSVEGIEYNSLLTMPVGIANINWYGVARGQDSIYMLKHNVLEETNDPVEAFAINEHYLNEIDKEIAAKMRWFAKGFYTVEKVNGNIRIYNLQVDMRGVVSNEDHKAPTVGYFEISNVDGRSVLSSGSITGK